MFESEIRERHSLKDIRVRHSLNDIRVRVFVRQPFRDWRHFTEAVEIKAIGRAVERQQAVERLAS